MHTKSFYEIGIHISLNISVRFNTTRNCSLFVSHFHPNARITHHHHHYHKVVSCCPGQVVCVAQIVFCCNFFLDSFVKCFKCFCQWGFRLVLSHLKCFSSVFTATSINLKKTTCKIIVNFGFTKRHKRICRYERNLDC